MTCEINIDTSRVWEVGRWLGSGRNPNYDALWNDINKLDAALNSLRGFNNSSGSVVSRVERSQEYLNRCKTRCIEPTTSAMVRTASFLQETAVQYENTERYAASLWDKYPRFNWIGAVVGSLPSLFEAIQAAKAERLDHVKDFIGQCCDAFVKAWNFVSPALSLVAEFVTVAALISFAWSNPVGWVVLGGYAIASIYKHITGGSIVGDGLALGVELATGDKELATKAKIIGGFGQDVLELCLPGGLVAKGAAKVIKGAQGGTKVAKLLKNGNKVSTFLRKPSKVLTTPVKRLAQSGRFGRASSKVHSFSNAVSVKNNPMKYLTSKYASTKKVSQKINKVYGKFSSVKSSGGAISGVYDFSTKIGEEKTEYKNRLSDVWHSCFE